MAIKTGLHRIAQALWWLSWGLAAIGAAIAVWGLSEGSVSFAAMTLIEYWIPSGAGLLLSWIIEGFANKEG